MVFAAICTGINLGSQAITALILGSSGFFQGGLSIAGKVYQYSFLVQILTGTILGFVTKFILDKFLVFQNSHENFSSTLKQIFIYGSFAVITTLIFWGFEFTFKAVFQDDQFLTLLGGFIGLAIGYSLKFFLDKSFVFNKTSPKTTNP